MLAVVTGFVRRALGGLALGAALCALASSAAGAETPPAAQDEKEDAKAVRQLALDYVAAVRPGNRDALKRIGEIAAPDVVMVWSNGQAGSSRATLLEWFARELDTLAEHFRKLDMRYDIRSIRLFVDTAIVFGKLAVTGTLKEGDAPFRRDVWLTMVFAKAPAGWQLVHEHSTPAAAPPAPAP